MEDAARRKAAADVEAAHAVEAARSELAAAQREAEVLRAGAGADKDSALAGLKVPVRAPGAQHAVMQCVQRPWRTDPISADFSEPLPWPIPAMQIPCLQHQLWHAVRERGVSLQAEQEHALAESRKHAAAAQAQLSAELDSARAKLAAATEQLDQQPRSFTAGAEEERRAAQSKEALLQASTPLGVFKESRALPLPPSFDAALLLRYDHHP